MGGGGFADADRRGEIADAEFMGGQGGDDAATGWIAKGGQEFGEITEAVGGGKKCPSLAYMPNMDDALITGVGIEVSELFRFAGSGQDCVPSMNTYSGMEMIVREGW